MKFQNDIIFEYLEAPSAPKAVHRGVQLVSTEYFATLDDDDELLELAIDKRLSAIESKRDIDFVITNGYRNQIGTDNVWHNNLNEIQIDPLGSLMEANWLTSCNAIFRKHSVGSDIFFDNHPYGEWTWLAFKLILTGKRVAVLNTATFRINDTPGSLSKSRRYEESYIPLFKKMLDFNLPRNIKTQIQRKLSAAYHDASDTSLSRGDMANAVKWHLLSLLEKRR